MVAGKVRAAMGFHKSPSHHRNKPPPETSTATPPPPKPPPPPLRSPGSTASAATSSASESHTHSNNNNNRKQSTVFARSFGVYFPRSSSAQVQPRPPDVAELLRVVEELRDRESRLKTELLESKILKETASIVPILESAINNKNDQLDRAGERIEILDRENEELKAEVKQMREKMEETRAEADARMHHMEREIAELKKNVADKEREITSSQRFLALNDLSSKSGIIKSLKRVRCTDPVSNNNNIYNNYNASVNKSSIECVVYSKTTSFSDSSESNEDREKPRHSRCNSEEFLAADSVLRSRVPRVPKPPPKRSCSSSALSPPLITTSDQSSLAPPPPPRPPPPPPPPPPARHNAAHPLKKVAPPPPPPPPPVKGLRVGAAKVRRVPEVVEFYHSLMRRDSRKESNNGGCGCGSGGGAGVNGGAVEAVLPVTANARDMIGEIENRSAHLLAVSIWFGFRFLSY